MQHIGIQKLKETRAPLSNPQIYKGQAIVKPCYFIFPEIAETAGCELQRER